MSLLVAAASHRRCVLVCFVRSQKQCRAQSMRFTVGFMIRHKQ